MFNLFTPVFFQRGFKRQLIKRLARNTITEKTQGQEKVKVEDEVSTQNAHVNST